MADHAGKQHVSIVVAGHVDAGKSSLTGRLLYDLGGIDPREMVKLRKIAEENSKPSFAFAYFMDNRTGIPEGTKVPLRMQRHIDEHHPGEVFLYAWRYGCMHPQHADRPLSFSTYPEQELHAQCHCPKLYPPAEEGTARGRTHACGVCEASFPDNYRRSDGDRVLRDHYKKEHPGVAHVLRCEFGCTAPDGLPLTFVNARAQATHHATSECRFVRSARPDPRPCYVRYFSYGTERPVGLGGASGCRAREAGDAANGGEIPP